LKYRLIDHTADYGIEAFGKDLKQVFENAAFAICDLIIEPNCLQGRHTEQLIIIGDDVNDLMMNWLREILYRFHGMEMLIKQTSVQQIIETRLMADITYDFFEKEHHEIQNEIKAITYHQFEVQKVADGWVARFIVDV
jgi:SHS2 domain-containing protein